MTPALAIAAIGAVVAIVIGALAALRSWGWDRTGVVLGLTAVGLGVTSLIIVAAALGWRGWP